jgi:hypothetical protein
MLASNIQDGTFVLNFYLPSNIKRKKTKQRTEKEKKINKEGRYNQYNVLNVVFIP